MVIEFRKVSTSPKSFEEIQDSVKIEGTFCKISPKLVKIISMISGEIEVECCRCAAQFTQKINEDIEFLVSDGVYKSDSDDSKYLDTIVIEIDNHMIDFKDIVQSELESFKLDYHTCDDCLE